ncbi:MAG: sialidase family protein [Candidatus Acidiferrales bacterium]
MRKKILAGAALCVGMTLAWSAAAGAQTLAPPPGSKVTPLTAGGFFDEPAIAVNARNPQQVTGAYQVTAHAAYSTDAGEHWETASGTASKNYFVSGDVSVTYDKQGRAILCYIAFDRLGTTDYWAHGATRNGIFIRRSPDGGKTWEPKEITVIAQPTKPGIPFEDKPDIVADNTDGPYAGNLYIGWTEFTLTETVILFSRSTDGGETWSAPVRISTRAGLPRDDNGAVEGFTGAVGTDGTLYVCWGDNNAITFTTSADGGRTFAPSRVILNTAPIYFHAAHVERANGFPEMGIDPKSGRLFVVWADYRNGDVDVFCATSEDRGATWSDARRVNSDGIHDGADQFFQWLSVDPVDGSANVIFYDRRNDPTDRKVDVVLARSTDGGKTFANYLWSTESFDPDDDFIGDYNGIAAYGGRVYGIWAEKISPEKAAKNGGQPEERPAAGKKAHFTRVMTAIADFNKPAAASGK